MRLPVSDYYELISYLSPFPSYCRLLVKFAVLTAVGVPVFNILGTTKFGSQETRLIALLYGVDILTDSYFVLLQCTHLTDRQMLTAIACIACTCIRTVKMLWPTIYWDTTLEFSETRLSSFAG